MTTEEKSWSLRIGYDYRFGTLMVQPVDPSGAHPEGPFIIRVSDVLRQAKIEPHELRALIEDSKAPEVPLVDMEVFRRQAIASTDVKDKVVLDVGGYMGEFSIQAMEQGAKRAIVLDNEQWRHYGWPDKTGPAKEKGVEFVQGSLTDYQRASRDTIVNPMVGILPRPDVIINYNLLYHLKNPWAYLDRCREVIAEGGEMLLCTLFRYHDGPWMYVYEPRECNPTDDTVYFGPSIAALERLLKATGWDFTQEGLTFDRVIYRCRPTAGFVRTHEDD